MAKKIDYIFIINRRCSMHISEALAQIQAKIQNPKNTAANPYFKSKYAPLPAILDMIRPLNRECGLSLEQYPETRFEGGKHLVGVRTVIRSSVGDKEEERDYGFLGVDASDRNPQDIGSVITYFRRYALKAIYAIEGEGEDDDANTASGKKEPPAKKQKGDVAQTKADFLAATTTEARNAILKRANSQAWAEVEYQDLAIFFDTELARIASQKVGE